MKRRALLIFVLTLTMVFGALAPATNILRTSTRAQSVSATPAGYPRAEELPLTDRIPWLIYVVLTSAVLALAWILFSLAREQRRNARLSDKEQT